MFDNGSNGTWSYLYDGASRLTQAVLDYPGTTPPSTQWDYKYDGAGNRTLVKQTTLPDTVTSNVSTTYDSSGLPTTATDSVPGGESITYTHDKIGDLTLIDSSAASNDWSYGYDAYGRLSCAKQATTCTSGTTRVQPSYDALNRAIGSMYNGTTTSNWFRGVSDTLTRQAGAVATAYANDVTGTPVAEKASAAYFYLRDPHGDLVSSVSTTATKQTTRAFDPYGRQLTPWQASGSQPVLGYQSDLTDSVTTLVDMGARNYAPVLGRFTSRDIISGAVSSPMTLNRFAYAEMGHISGTDPTGTTCNSETNQCGTGTVITHGKHEGEYAYHDPDTGEVTYSGSGGRQEQGDWGSYQEPVPVPAPEKPSFADRLVGQIPRIVSNALTGNPSSTFGPLEVLQLASRASGQTFGVCASTEGDTAVAGSFEACLVATPQDSGLLLDVGGGIGGPPGGSVSAGWLYSPNVTSLQDLNGGSVSFGANAGPSLGVGGSYTTNGKYDVYQAEFGIQRGSPVTVSGQAHQSGIIVSNPGPW